MYPCIADFPRHPRQQHVVVDPIEELLQIEVHHPALAFADVRSGFAYRVVSTADLTLEVSPGWE
jgi:hypothetical protein